ncbi:MAG: response regulator [Desulfovibrio sp.]|nr:response regulator [Desulfovibrio sp.]MBI4960897.1 response regulator [Desulfovibrio sp.]
MNTPAQNAIARPYGDGATQSSLRILCIDDEPAIRLSIQVFLEDHGHTVTTALNGLEGLKAIESQEFDCILLDLAMPGISGLEVLNKVKEMRPNLPVIVVSGTGSIPDVINALRLGAWDFITKPIEDMAILLYAMDRAMERARLIRENQLHNERLETLVKERTRDLRSEIAERLAVEKALRASLAEKEVLLREVHHRVKNNLQIVSSLLSLQAAKSDHEMSGEFLDSQARVRAMALVHEKLYSSEDLSCINFPEYLRQLAAFLLQAYTPESTTITPDIHCPDFCLPVNSAIPCGLIINELFTNSLKHAFAGRPVGRIILRAWLKDNTANLLIADDGAGLRPGFDIKETETLGLQLVTNLTRQLKGSLKVSSGPGGAAFHLRFPNSPARTAPSAS